MSVLRADPFSRAGGAAHGFRRRKQGGGVTLFVLMFASLALIVLSRLNHSWVHGMRGELVEAMLPVLETVSVPAIRLQQIRRKIGGYVKVLNELDRLEEQNERLRHWETRAQDLEREIAKYRVLLRARDTRTFRFVSGRVVADGRGPFARSIILNIGANQNIRDGYPVVNGDGLVGRTLNTGATAARVLLLTDLNSRVPVVFGKTSVRGILTGNNNPRPEITFTPQTAAPVVGDDVRTSGHGGLFPSGLRVGRVEAIKPKIIVALHADTDSIDFVSVLLVDQPRVTDVAQPEMSSNRPDVQTSTLAPPYRRGTGNRKSAGRVMALPTRPRNLIRNDAMRRKTVKARRKP